MKTSNKENRALDFAFRCIRVLERKYKLVHVLVRVIEEYKDDVCIHAVFRDFVIVFYVHSDAKHTDVLFYDMLSYAKHGKFLTTKTKPKKWEKTYFF